MWCKVETAGQPAAQRGRGADDVGGRQVGVHQLHAVRAQLRGRARHGPRVPAGEAELDDRHTEPPQRADVRGVGGRGERDDHELQIGLGRRARQVDQADLRAVRVQGRDEVRDLHMLPRTRERVTAGVDPATDRGQLSKGHHGRVSGSSRAPQCRFSPAFGAPSAKLTTVIGLSTGIRLATVPPKSIVPVTPR